MRKQRTTYFLLLTFFMIAMAILAISDTAQADLIADVIVTKNAPLLFIDTDCDGRASPGDTLSWSIDVTNMGPNVATDVVLTDLLDENLSLSPLSSPEWSTFSRTVSYGYDANWQLISATDSNGTIAFEYDAIGNLISETDPLGNITQFTYDAVGNLISETDPLGNITTFGYDSEGNLISETDADGNTIAHRVERTDSDIPDLVTSYTYDPSEAIRTYDASGNLISETDPLGNTTTFTYDTAGNRLTETDPLGNTTSFTYDAAGNRLTETDPLGNIATFTYDTAGNRLTETDPLGNTTTFTYDAAGNRLTETDPLGNTTSFAYDTSGNLVNQTESLGSLTSYRYDSRGRAIEITESSPRQPTLFVGTLAPQAMFNEPIYTTIANPFPDSKIPIAFSIENSIRVTSDVADSDFTNNTFTRSTTASSIPSAVPEIDIKPNICPNSINPKSKQVIALAILTTDTFDATTVDPLTVKFGPNGATEAHGKGHIKDVDGDSDLDLVLHFKVQDTGIACGDTSASLTGETFSGEPIEGSDSINTVGCK
jgi:uncharacterized repeat protein (TIGR01451 family)